MRLSRNGLVDLHDGYGRCRADQFGFWCAANYKMYDYVTKELMEIIEQTVKTNGKKVEGEEAGNIC